MGKLKCKCGHVIVDQTDSLEYKGYILPDSHVEVVSNHLIHSIDTLLEATKSGKRLDWIQQNFKVPPYPTDAKDSEMIHDLITEKTSTQEIFECENCGRIAIQVGQTNEFKFFTPDSEDTKGILNGKKN